MRNRVAYLGAALFAVSALLLSPAMADKKRTYTTTTTTESGVRSVCGKDLQSNGGVIGCTKQCGTSTCDHSCGGPGGKGCRTIVMTAGAPPLPKPWLTTGVTTKQSTTKELSTTTKTSAAAGPPKAGLLSDGGTGASKTGSSSKTSTKNQTATDTLKTTTTGTTR